jgi:hypothetical protein
MQDTVVTHDTVVTTGTDWQAGLHLTHNPIEDTIAGKPVAYYLNDPQCSPIAKDFYYGGDFRPSDNYTTAALLDLSTTHNDKLRPFYRWCLAKSIEVEDGALGEVVGEPARRYATQYPKEFLSYVAKDSTERLYDDWVDAIAYSGLSYDTSRSAEAKAIEAVRTTMRHNCRACDSAQLARIDQFANDIASRGRQIDSTRE